MLENLPASLSSHILARIKDKRSSSMSTSDEKVEKTLLKTRLQSKKAELNSDARGIARGLTLDNLEEKITGFRHSAKPITISTAKRNADNLAKRRAKKRSGKTLDK
jgi:hypothetical protein